MKTEQKRWSASNGWEKMAGELPSQMANLIFVFGGRQELTNPERIQEIKKFYPNAIILTASTAGEITGTQVTDDCISSTAVQFEKTKIRTAETTINAAEGNSYNAGKTLGTQLLSSDLVHVFVLSDGLKVNGSELVKGFNEVLPSKILVTGGLAGDAAKFDKTLVGLDNVPTEGRIVAVGFYGSSIKIGHGSQGGWDPFGPTRIVTKSKSNVLYELDGQSALSLYKKYLGDKASGLPGTGLLFPISLRENEKDSPVVRTLLAVDEANQSMTFAGDVPEKSTVQLMKANFEKLIDGAGGAAEKTNFFLGDKPADLAILISCVGRKLVLGQRIEEEVESVRDILGESTALAGFYSYGEISPLTPEVSCELHNQTMTITTFSEA